MWASIIGAIMSIGYCTIALGLGASMASNGLGSLTGRPAPPLTKTMNIFGALGDFDLILLAGFFWLRVFRALLGAAGDFGA